MNTSKATESLDDWLAVSTEGFAAMNAGRAPAHLVKELMQNALDALGDRGGQVALTAEPSHLPGKLRITCRDDGCGMINLADIRTIFHTSKTDSHLQRGRMGRGFKEMLCLAEGATVTSGSRRIEFLIEDGRRITRQTGVGKTESVAGALVRMLMPWDAKVIADLEEYFRRLLVPKGVDLQVNGRRIEPRAVAHRAEAKLPTELFEAGRWIRPVRNTVIELVKTAAGEEPTVYEMGIPICPVEWDVPYHASVQQRVPMNPCRDAVASGYGTGAICSVTLALLRPVNAIATWSSGDVLTLGIDTSWLWTDPFGEESLATLIHEAAHHQNAHHGRDFHKEMEKLAGRGARIMLLSAEKIRHQYAQLLY